MGRPAAKWTSYARAGRVQAFLLVGLPIQNNRLVIQEAHMQQYN
jgi:hypothetical protein